MVDYTHTFEFKFGDTPKIEGQVEFNVDGKASFETKKTLPNLTTEQGRKIVQLFEIMRQLFLEFDEIEKIEVKKK